MNIHCSACGAALPSGAKFCPACALPLTAIAMPTPPPPRPRPTPFWVYIVGALLIFWAVAYSSDRITEQKREAAAASAPDTRPRLTPEEIRKDAEIDARYERQIDREIWNSPEKIRNRIALLSLNRDAENDRSIARLQKRLKEMHAQ